MEGLAAGSKYLVLTIGVIKQNVGIWYMPRGMQHEIPHATGGESRVMSQLECRRSRQLHSDKKPEVASQRELHTFP